ncbi:MAG: cobalamin-independent methionine synthase II family protein [Limnohabitans sp.]|jgi:5-methyltetrahydropteroyltriglutamate--homocysteine methyltransferase|nr:cobalamin-independent methionine synthase II family protein [Limnohabitans sp.]
MHKSDQRILTTHTGSLPRPTPLVELYARRARQEPIDEQALDQMGRAAMIDSVQRQIDSGLDVINNGEQQREGFFLYVQRKLSGFGGAWKRWPRADVERYPVFKQALESAASGKAAVSNFAPPKVVGEVRYLDPGSASDEAVQFRQALGDVQGRYTEAFLTAPSPGIIASACLNEHYDSERAYLRALGEALRHEYEAVVEQGFVLQLDCPDLALERHVSFHACQDAEFLKFAELVVETLNDALRNIPPDRVRMHVCWGNYEGPHDCDIDLHTIWPIIRQARVGGFVLPFANARHAHEMKVLREQPLQDHQVIVAGVIDVLTNFIEHPEVVAQRLELMARELGDPSRVLAGTDCGFDTSAGMGRVATDVVWAKLQSLSQGARLASQRLFA